MPRKQARRKSTFGTVTCLRSGRYSGRYLDPQGHRRSLGRTYGTEREAWAALAAVQTDMTRGRWIDPDDGEILFEDFAELVRDVRANELAPRTKVENAYLLRRLLPTFGGVPLNKVSVRLVDTWWGKHADHPVQRRNAYFLLSNIMKHAVWWGYIAHTPCLVDKAGKDVAAPRPIFSTADFEAVVEHLTPELQRVMRVVYGLHLRVSEVCGLQWGDVDWKNNVVTVSRQAVRGKAGQTGRTKNGDEKVITPMVLAVEALQGQYKARPGIGATPIFHGPSGGHLRPEYVEKKWRDACLLAEVAGMRVHDVRHVSLTVVGQSTKSLATVMDRDGHRTPKAAMRYQAATREADVAAARAADEAVSQQRREADRRGNRNRIA